MKRRVKIVIDPKKLRIMSNESEKVARDCVICIEDIQKSVDAVLSNIETEFKNQRNRMTDEWNTFLAVSDEKLNNSIITSRSDLDSSISHTEKETDKLNTNSRWILGIILGVTFMLGTVVGFTWERMSKKADRSEVVTLREFQFLYELTKSYNANQFIQNPNAKVDSTNYDLIVKAVLQGTMRGGK